jgi:prepilin-type N-terminal cleavage/methylation domain-containing protein
MRNNQRGFSLIEVVVALALLAGVLISIAGLFVIGARQVESGREATEALSVARGIVEQMNKWGFHQTYELFGANGSAATYTWDTRTITDPPTTGMGKWQPMLSQKIPGAYATITVTSVGPGTPPVLNLTRAMRVVVTVRWQERMRQRQVQLATVRM